MQRRVTLWCSEVAQKNNELDQLLADGWRVVHSCPFCEPVAIATGPEVESKKTGIYGIIFIVEKENEGKTK